MMSKILPTSSYSMHPLFSSSQRSCVIIIFAKVSSDKAEDSSKYREVPLDTFRKVILSGARAPERELT